MKKWVISIISIFIALFGIKDVNATSVINDPVLIKDSLTDLQNVGNYLGSWNNTTQYKNIQIFPMKYGSTNNSYEFQSFSSGTYNIHMTLTLYSAYQIPLNEIEMWVDMNNNQSRQTCDIKNVNDNYAILPDLVDIQQPTGIAPKYLIRWEFQCERTILLGNATAWMFNIKYIDNSVGPLAVIVNDWFMCDDDCSEAMQTYTDRSVDHIIKDIQMSQYNSQGIDNWLYAENSISGTGKQLFNDYQNQLNFTVDTNTQNFLWNIADTFLRATPLIIGTLTLCISIAFIKLVLNR